MSEIEPHWSRVASRHLDQTPFFAHLKGELVSIDAGGARMRVPYGPHLVGDPDTGVVHGGVITALLDHTAGAAVMVALREPVPIATLDLRIDYMKPAVPAQDIIAHVHCLKVTRDIAFVRGTAYQSGPEDPIAICTAAFMLTRNSPG